MDWQKEQTKAEAYTTKQVNVNLATVIDNIIYSIDCDERENALEILVNILSQDCVIRYGNEIDREYLLNVIGKGKEAADELADNAWREHLREASE